METAIGGAVHAHSHRHRGRTRLTAGLGGLSAALVLLSACGGAGGTTGAAGTPAPHSSGSSTPTGSPAAGGSSGTGSGSTASDVRLSSANFGKVLTRAQRRAGSFTFTMTSETAGQQIRATGAAEFSGGGTPDARTTMQVGGQEIRVLTVDGLYYLKSPILQTPKPWLKVDPHASSGLGAMIGQLGGGTSPTGSLEALFGASTVSRTGTETVGGTRTTEYRVVVPRKALLGAMHYPQQLASLLPKKIGYDVWVDGHDLVRRMHMTMHLQGQSSQTDIRMGHYGDPVHVQAPPAAKTTTKSGLGGGGSATGDGSAMS